MYRIIEIRPKAGKLYPVHLSVLNQECKIKKLAIGEQGMLLVDVGDKIIGPHRIQLSTVERVTENEADSTMAIETENTVYVLKEIDQEDFSIYNKEEN